MSVKIVNCSAILTDTHLGIFNSSDYWHDVTFNFFQKFHDICKKEDVKRIIHLGDFFHNRRALNLKTIFYALAHIAPILDQFETYLVVGNHDTFYQTQIKPHSLIVFEQFENIHVVDEPLLLDDIALVPWGCEFENLEVDTIMGHFAINGFKMNSGFVFDLGYKQSDFQSFKNVISGHFHKPAVNGNIQYIGAPFQQNFNDEGGERGFYLYRDKQLKFVEYTDAPQFITLTARREMKDGIQEKKKISGNAVRVIFEEDFGNEINGMILDSVRVLEPLRIHIDFSRISAQLTKDDVIEDVDIKSNEEILREFIEKISTPENINKKTALKMLVNIMENIKKKKE